MHILYDKTAAKVLVWLQGPYTVDGKPADLPGNIVDLEVRDLPAPGYDPATQKLETTWQADLVNLLWVPAYHISEKTAEEKAEYLTRAAEAEDEALPVDVLKKIIRPTLASLDPEEKEGYYSLFVAWRPGQTVTAGQIYQHEGALWEVIQSHTTQADWRPNMVPALFKRHYNPEVIPAWKQPTGAHDAYAKGAKVMHVGMKWESTVNANVWEPGIYGWVVV